MSVFAKRCSALTALCLFSAVVSMSLPAQETSAAQAQVQRETVIADAKKYIGCPYEDGAIGPDSFDCSGFIYFIVRDSLKIQLPRTAKAMYSFVRIVPDSKLEPGDLVFFRTTDSGSISHVGLYIGKKQFIHAASDGPNNGVIASSLSESYWKTHYAGAGKFLDAGTGASDDEEVVEEDVTRTDRKTGHSSSAKENGSGGSSGFVDSLLCGFSLSFDWSLFTTNQFVPNYRGLNTQADITVTKWPLNPGAGIMLRWNYGVHALQMPIIFSLSFNEFMRVYAGPVITMGSCVLPATEDEISPSFFPGIAGISFCLPSFTAGDVKVRIIQDICYTVFNRTDGSALSFGDSMTAGFVLSTGVRVTFPFSKFIK